MKFLMLIALFAAGSLAETQPDTPATAASAKSAEPAIYAVINTSMGTIKARLFEDQAPETVRHFVGLANGSEPWNDPSTGRPSNQPLYQNLPFSRVIPGFAIQTGDPTGTGKYDCGSRVKDEFSRDLKFDRPGRLGMMNAGAPNSGACQFFITDDAYPALDASSGRHGYTIFGQVVEGQDVVTRISILPADANGRPATAVSLLSVTIQRVGPKPAVVTGSAPKTPARKTRLPIPD